MTEYALVTLIKE